MSKQRTYPKYVVIILLVLVSTVALLFITAFPRPQPMDRQTIEGFVDQTLLQWKETYGSQEGLKVARIDVLFRATPENFAKSEGAVITPVGIDLPKGQKILATAAYPKPVRQLSVDGVKAVAWTYPGKCRSNFRYVALTLVKQPPHPSHADPVKPTFSALPESFRADALAKAAELKEHDLEECAAFGQWPRTIAGGGTYLRQFKTIVTTIASGIYDADKGKASRSTDDICSAMRKLRFSHHIAHVLGVMACRQLDIPCYGFISATGKKNFIVGTYSDQTGWIYYDFARPEKGFFTDPPVLLTLAPLISDFEGCGHGYWRATASAYETSTYGIMGFSGTGWGTGNADSDYTIARSFHLNEWAP